MGTRIFSKSSLPIHGIAVPYLYFNICFKNVSELKNFKNLQLVNPDVSSEFVAEINKTSDVILFGAINHTDSKLYKQIKKMLDEMNIMDN